MQDETLQAAVQYNDLRGTVAADRADQLSFEAFAKAKGLDIKGREIYGLQMYNGERGNFTLDFLVAVHQKGDRPYRVDEPPLYEKIDIEVTVQEALTLFKRFEIVLINRTVQGERFQHAPAKN